MRVALEYTTVHIGTRVSLICITDKVLPLSVCRPGKKFPFHPGGKPCSTTTAQAGFLDIFDHLFRLAVCKQIDKGGVSADSHVVINLKRIDLFVLLQKQPALIPVKRNIALLFNDLTCFIIYKKKIIHNLSSQGRVNDPSHCLGIYPGIKRP